jgi:23S rRNA (guanosine2251-2'-O)-methyltransferase
VSSKPERNAPRKGWDPSRSGGGKRHNNKAVGAADPDAKDWLWGVHSVEAALENPHRPPPRKLLATPDRARRLAERFPAPSILSTLETVDAAEIARRLPPGASHQGLALKIDPPEPLDLISFAEPAHGIVVMLDQISDPQNIGAIFRSAAAFGARGIILQDRHAPALSGSLAKAAVGAIDRLPHARAVNLSRALETFSDHGWRIVGLAGEADVDLPQALDGSPTVLVMGSEGEGLRRMVAEHCDILARIPLAQGMESLNVSAAAAVALYEAARVRA